MKLPLSRVLVGSLLLGLGVAGWFWPASPERIIRRQLTQIAELLSFPPNEPPLNALSEVNQLCTRLAPDIEVVVDAPGFGRRNVHGREEIRDGLLAYRQRFNGVQVNFPDIRVEPAPDRTSAVAYVTVQARLPGESEQLLQEVKLLFRKQDSRWLLARAETVQPLR
jgi:hypothetical protein